VETAIEWITAHEILDSRGQPTLEALVGLANGSNRLGPGAQWRFDWHF
jgi:enolase